MKWGFLVMWISWTVGQINCKNNHVSVPDIFESIQPTCATSFLKTLNLRGGGGSKRSSQSRNPVLQSSDESLVDDFQNSNEENRRELSKPLESSDVEHKGGSRKAEKVLEKKLDAYVKKYGLSTGTSVNPLKMILDKADRAMDSKMRFKLQKENFALQEKDIDAIKKTLKEDDAKRLCRSSHL
jgi:hypothetical protein